MLGIGLWNSTRTGHILPMRGSFATSIVRQHKGLYGQVTRQVIGGQNIKILSRWWSNWWSIQYIKILNLYKSIV